MIQGQLPHGITRQQIPVQPVVDLGAIASSSLPDPRSATGWVGMAVSLWSVLRRMTLPSAFLTTMSPSPNFYALFSIQRIRAR